MTASVYDGPAWPCAPAGTPLLMRWTRVPARHDQALRHHAARAAKRLGLGQVRIRYFEPAGDQPPDFWIPSPGPDDLVSGLRVDDQPMTIGINAHIRGPELVGTVAHEVRHLAQPPRSPSRAHEAQAAAYAIAYQQEDHD